jgi:Kef-type K+ transport system membrane component KefB
MVLGLIILVAVVGKMGGCFAAARLVGFRWRDSLAVGTLMNTRGLMELIVVQVGLDLGVISRRLYTMLVIMALATTFLTTPLLRLLMGRTSERVPARRAPESLVPDAEPSNQVT